MGAKALQYSLWQTDYCWIKAKGFAAKATLVLLSVLATQALATYNFKKFGYPSIRISEVRC